MTRPLWQLSACEMREGLRARRFLSTEIIESVAGRISTRNGHINAIVDDYTDQALREAEAADAASANGRAIGPLHGIPVTIKTNIDVSGTPTPNGLPIFKDLIAPDDAPVVRNLRQAGALVIGRTNTPELSMRATTDNPLHGKTCNPWDEAASPGGSSGGASAAAAAGSAGGAGRQLRSRPTTAIAATRATPSHGGDRRSTATLVTVGRRGARGGAPASH